LIDPQESYLSIELRKGAQFSISYSMHETIHELSSLIWISAHEPVIEYAACLTLKETLLFSTTFSTSEILVWKVTLYYESVLFLKGLRYH
jgi:hypothetical protein